MCTSWVCAEDFQPLCWGGRPGTDALPWLSLFTSNGTETPSGSDYLAMTKALTTTGCPGSSQPLPSGTSPAATSLPTIQGTPAVGSTLTASPGTWSGTPAPSFSLQWESCDVSGSNCQAIEDQNTTSYTVQGSDVGDTLRFVVVATSIAGGTTATSAATAAVPSIASGATTPSAISSGGGTTVTTTTTSGTPKTTTRKSMTIKCAGDSPRAVDHGDRA